MELGPAGSRSNFFSRAGGEPGIFGFSLIFSLNTSSLDHLATGPPFKKRTLSYDAPNFHLYLGMTSKELEKCQFDLNLAFSEERLLEMSRHSSKEDLIDENLFSDSSSESDCALTFDSSATDKRYQELKAGGLGSYLGAA